MTKLRSLIAFLVLTVFLGACSSEISKMTIRTGKTGDIEVTDLRSVERNGLLTAQATLMNHGNSKPVAYRFRWLSKDGMRVSGDEVWKPLTIQKGRSQNIEGIAPSAQATDFRVELDSF
jgi:uncharacterized protein YcfL